MTDTEIKLPETPQEHGSLPTKKEDFLYFSLLGVTRDNDLSMTDLFLNSPRFKKDYGYKKVEREDFVAWVNHFINNCPEAISVEHSSGAGCGPRGGYHINIYEVYVGFTSSTDTCDRIYMQGCKGAYTDAVDEYE